MVECVLSQLKPSELYILSSTLFTAKDVEFLGLYSILNAREQNLAPPLCKLVINIYSGSRGRAATKSYTE